MVPNNVKSYLLYFENHTELKSLKDSVESNLGMKINAIVDDDAPVVAEIMGTDRKMDYSEMHVGGIDVGSMVTSNSPGFRGALQQLTFNGEKLFELANTGQLAIKHTVILAFLPY